MVALEASGSLTLVSSSTGARRLSQSVPSRRFRQRPAARGFRHVLWNVHRSGAKIVRGRPDTERPHLCRRQSASTSSRAGRASHESKELNLRSPLVEPYASDRFSAKAKADAEATSYRTLPRP